MVAEAASIVDGGRQKHTNEQRYISNLIYINYYYVI